MIQTSQPFYASKFLTMFLLLFIIPIAQTPIRDRNSPSINYHRLTRALDDVYRGSNRLLFQHNIASEAKRYNVSESEYSGACFESYFHLVPSWSELVTILKERNDLSQYFMHNSSTQFNASTNFLSEEMREAAPLTHAILKEKFDVLGGILAKALPETRKFFEEVQKDFEIFFIEIITYEDPDADYYDIFANKSRKYNALILKEGNRYNKLSSRTKVDLERHLCLRNTFIWLNTYLDNQLSRTFDLFWKDIELDIDALLEDNPYLSNISRIQVVEMFEKRAKTLNIAAQEYVDVCATVFRAVRLNESDFNDMHKHFSDSMEMHWGKATFNSSDQLLYSLNISTPYVDMAIRAWNFAKQIPMIPYVQTILRNVEKEFLRSILKTNNEHVLNREGKAPLHSLQNIVYNPILEKTTCFVSTLESIHHAEVDFDGWEIETLTL